MGSRKKDAKHRRREQRLAERASRFERHAALVVERHGDPRYVQRTLNPDGSQSLTLPPEMMDLMLQQRERFREKFGRDIRPDDPIFFDPDAEEPVPVPAEHYEELLQAFADDTDDPELRSLALASLDTGYMVTELNQHLFTAHEVEAFSASVTKHLEVHTQQEGLIDFIESRMQAVIGMIADGSADVDLPRFLIEELLSERSEASEHDAGLVISMMLAVPLRLLVSAKAAGIGENELNIAAQWIADNLGGVDYAGPASAVATAIWGGDGQSHLEQHLGTSEPTFNDMHELLGQDFAPAMMWLCAGLIATAGDGDIEWLRVISQREDSDT
ncbi:hypothetical protein [Nonomuraea insulae]|uniref:DUF1186 domain-containing protein n=1 Tax=Nonomuraea insulae TaxID=1616787 RepID=A0ABW1CWU3_9ACTN